MSRAACPRPVKPGQRSRPLPMLPPQQLLLCGAALRPRAMRTALVLDIAREDHLAISSGVCVHIQPTLQAELAMRTADASTIAASTSTAIRPSRESMGDAPFVSFAVS